MVSFAKTSVKASSIAVVLMIVLFAACQGKPRGKDGRIASFVENIEAAPAWITLDAQDRKIIDPRVSQLESLGQEFCLLPVDEARSVVEKFTEKANHKTSPGEPVDSLSKLYVLLRYYFNVPAHEEPGKVEFFGGYVGRPASDASVNMLWPLDVVDGRLKVVHGCTGFMGPPYDPVAEFDYFNQRYGRRPFDGRKEDNK